MIDVANLKKLLNSPYVQLMICMAMAFALYHESFTHAWTYDDFPVIVDNPDVKSWQGFLTDSYPGRPVREFTFLLDYLLFGDNPAGFHVQQIFWHALNGFLLFRLALKLKMPDMACWITSTIFLIHPIQVEVVANISHRKDSLALAFCLISLLAYIQFMTKDRRRSFYWLCLSIVAYSIGYQSKQNAIVLPFVFLLYEYSYVSKERRFLLRWPKVVFSSVVLISIGGIGWFFLADGGTAFLGKITKILLLKQNVFEPVTLQVAVAAILKSWGFMWVKLGLPINIAAEYVFPMPTTIFDPAVLLTVISIASVIIFAIWRRATLPLVLFGGLWFLFFWLPTSNIWPLAYLAADRYLYAPSVGLFLLFGWALTRYLNPKALSAILPIIFCLLCALSWQQIKVWKNPETLWTQAVKVSPTSPFALNNMGNVVALQGHSLKALEYYQRSAKTNPYNITTHYNLGWIYEILGNRPMALRNYRNFVSIKDPAYRVQREAIERKLFLEYGIRPGS